MDLREILSEDIIDLDLKGTTKDEILHELSQHLFDAGYITDIDQFVKDIYVREAAGITGAGNHIAIPHGKSSSVKKITIAVGRSEHYVEWESYDEQPVNLFFLFCVSDDEGLPRTTCACWLSLPARSARTALSRPCRQQRPLLRLSRFLRRKEAPRNAQRCALEIGGTRRVR